MYRSHWSLQRRPFEAVPDSRFLFPTAQHEHALAAIHYAACDGGEPVLLSGPPGCGKSLLLRTLRRRLPPEQYHVAFLPAPASAQGGLLRRVAYHLTRTSAADVETAMDAIAGHLAETGDRGGSVVLMFDDWPADASRRTLDELRWLLNPDVERARVCILLAWDGSVEPRWPTWLSQRLLATARVGPLQAGEVPGYLEHRLRAAGHPHGKLFTDSAAARVAEWSAGVPRLVNRVAHLALHAACLSGADRVDEEALGQALSRLAHVSTVVPRPSELPVGAQP